MRQQSLADEAIDLTLELAVIQAVRSDLTYLPCGLSCDLGVNDNDRGHLRPHTAPRAQNICSKYFGYRPEALVISKSQIRYYVKLYIESK